jgi:cellulose synthase/poly-beta-1,6-N-acetylglucosamine synthase-like glycosyltransferase
MVDDGSSDSTWNEMQKLKDIKNVVLMKKDNGGKHTANNLGIEIATGDYIATIDADTILEKNALNIIIGEFLNDPELDSVGSTILVRDPKTIVQYAQMIEYQMFSFTKTLLALVHGALVVPGAFSVYKKEVFEKIGVFKDAHKLEDLEITFRMQRHGMKVGQTHHALAYTNAPDTFIKLWNQRRRWGHGFLKNSYDYKKMFFSKANHNFGFFTLPMSLFSYIAISISFVITIFILLKNIFRIIIEVNLVGWKGFENLFARLFEFSVGPAAFIYLVILSCIFFLIMFGKHIVNERSINPLPIISFFVLYSLFIPVLVIKNIYDSITTSNIKWR